MCFRERPLLALGICEDKRVSEHVLKFGAWTGFIYRCTRTVVFVFVSEDDEVEDKIQWNVASRSTNIYSIGEEGGEEERGEAAGGRMDSRC